MRQQEFNDLLDAQLKRVQEVLGSKRAEYANDHDVLHNFKKAAALRKCSLAEAVSGMMVKHTVSVFDMAESGQDFPDAVWDEKLTDHINYLILLRACVAEEMTELAKELP